MEEQRIRECLTERTLGDLFNDYPYLTNMFEAIRLDDCRTQDTIVSLLNRHPDENFTDYGYTKADFSQALLDFIEEEDARTPDPLATVRSITLRGGFDKKGEPEDLDLRIETGEIVCVVGPTGSGKSQLLEDIESLAQKDTPTRRTVLVNGKLPDDAQRYEMDHRLVAYLTQNMNFVIDLPVGKFIDMHARCLGVEDVDAKLVEVIEHANRLSGEQFDADMPVTQLSGGQSRALMIADIALLSSSPIVLIDEIENAGIDKEKALDLLVQREKIVLMATHSPVLALMGDRRLVLENGAVKDVIETSDREKANLETLKRLDHCLLDLQNDIRFGRRFDNDIRDAFKAALHD